MTKQPDDLIPAAILLGPHGLKGAVKAKGQLENPDHLKGKTLPTSREGLTLTVTRWQEAARNQWILQFKETQKREDAETLHGVTLYLPKDALPPAKEGEVYFMDLVGRPVSDITGKPVGKVTAVLDTKAHPLLELENGKLIPAHGEFIDDLAATPLQLTEIGTELLTLE